MKIFLSLLSCLLYVSQQVLANDEEKRIVCYYDAQSSLRPGFAMLPRGDLEYSLQFCTHLIYGYAALSPHTHLLSSLNVGLDMFHYRQITNLKKQYPHLKKVYLSLGGDKDVHKAIPNKYLSFLEGGDLVYQNFIQSSISLLKSNGFDGLDLAFQFERNKPRKVHGTIGTLWKRFKKIFTGDFIVDANSEIHKQQFTTFVGQLHNVYQSANLSVSLTVLPNVNSTWYFDIPKIQNYFDYINLFAFDFLTPARNPNEADYTSPIYFKDEQNRLPHYNIDFQVNHWIENGCPAHKLNLGIATYGRAWRMTKDSELSGMPVVANTAGAAEVGLQSQIPGLLSWPEICATLTMGQGREFRGASAPLQKVVDIDRKYGTYAFRPADRNDEHGIWISFDDPDFAGIKAAYAKQKGLGGAAIFDLAYDDFRGLCTSAKYPILAAVKLNLS